MSVHVFAARATTAFKLFDREIMSRRSKIACVTKAESMCDTDIICDTDETDVGYR